MVADALDGKVSEYHIKQARMDDLIEEVKDLKSKGTLNPAPVKVNTKKKIEDFFKKQRDLNDFVKKGSHSDSREEDIEESEPEESKKRKREESPNSHLSKKRRLNAIE